MERMRLGSALPSGCALGSHGANPGGHCSRCPVCCRHGEPYNPERRARSRSRRPLCVCMAWRTGRFQRALGCLAILARADRRLVDAAPSRPDRRICRDACVILPGLTCRRDDPQLLGRSVHCKEGEGPCFVSGNRLSTTAIPEVRGPYRLPLPSSSSKKHSRIESQAARAVRTCVQIARCRGDIAVPQRVLHLRKRCATIDRVGAVGVPQPMRGNRIRDACLGRRTLHHTVDSALCERATGLAAGEDRTIGAGVAAMRSSTVVPAFALISRQIPQEL
jgi:hypothetical protein